jgi:hypothetical protein
MTYYECHVLFVILVDVNYFLFGTDVSFIILGTMY